jgi:hypothetical protein
MIAAASADAMTVVERAARLRNEVATRVSRPGDAVAASASLPGI